MNVLILAAGYATRLYPLTENQPKPLLQVAGKPMMEWVIDNLAPISAIEKVYVVTNNKFATHFQAGRTLIRRASRSSLSRSSTTTRRAMRTSSAPSATSIS
jgi:NDP-sugar pyrophosphorylase family protein